MSDVKLIKEERIKQDKAGLDVWPTSIRYAKTGFDSIDPDDMVRFKWHGVYQQRPKDGHFMMRIKVPGGRATTRRSCTRLAGISRDYGHGLADITTRQTIQFHWLTIEQMPDIFARLEAVGLTTAGACGDIARNITSSPAAGFDPQEIVDTRPVVDALQAFFHLNKDFGDLPRKYKIAVEGSPVQSTLPQINDASLIAYQRPSDGVVGYHFFVGGGLSHPAALRQAAGHLRPRRPDRQDRGRAAGHLRVLPGRRPAAPEAHPRPPEVSDGRVGAGEVHRRKSARSWTGRPTPPRRASSISDETYRDHIGVHAQKQPGLHWIGLCVLVGRMNADQMDAAADIADTVRRRRGAPDQRPEHADPAHPDREPGRGQGSPARGGLRVGRAQHPARRHRLHRHRVLQPGPHRDQAAHQGHRRPPGDGQPEPLRARPEDQHERLPQLLRPAPRRRHRPARLPRPPARRHPDRGL